MEEVMQRLTSSDSGGGLFSRVMAHILNACIHCIVTCTMWWPVVVFLSWNACGVHNIIIVTSTMWRWW